MGSRCSLVQSEPYFGSILSNKFIYLFLLLIFFFFEREKIKLKREILENCLKAGELESLLVNYFDYNYLFVGIQNIFNVMEAFKITVVEDSRSYFEYINELVSG